MRFGQRVQHKDSPEQEVYVQWGYDNVIGIFFDVLDDDDNGIFSKSEMFDGLTVKDLKLLLVKWIPMRMVSPQYMAKTTNKIKEAAKKAPPIKRQTPDEALRDLLSDFDIVELQTDDIEKPLTTDGFIGKYIKDEE